MLYMLNYMLQSLYMRYNPLKGKNSKKTLIEAQNKGASLSSLLKWDPLHIGMKEVELKMTYCNIQ